ncbi:ABC transporter ATP-binding protein [Acidiphilium acidophilum]|uniref:ABC transporter ATP-binding protein n=1 Tax=Acidiphilium acidophilum TaxID=76588 RepID=A0AAW9DVU3_ACIAO|nr:ABC transporter ATP-binding protein [Acidiphilium acidophilum]MDX5932835.1 ABC transporter ATP-binding protein [Acidiphilium acidophilum]GBQ12855.1 putative ABC transporter ATP-binding protein [Acidiphilium acidophilum DSM 700]
MDYLTLDAIAKHYGSRAVLRHVSLALRPGEFVSLLGPSGCGKTTLLRIVAGFDHPDFGRVMLDGKDITDIAPAKRQMGMVFQAYSLFPNMSAEDNVRFGLRVRKQHDAAQRSRARELLDLVGLAEHAAKYPHQLSGGQQQRVALARALAIRPSLLLLDEPLSALDAKVRVQLRDEIRRIQQETGVTTLFVTHDQEEALSISDRVVVMHEGVLAQVGTPAAIYGEPQSIFVARFVGAVAELPGTVADGHAGTVTILGRTVPASRARGMAAGTKIYFLLRPEAIRLGPPSSAGMLQGIVTASTFFGALTSLRVEIEGGSDAITAAMPSTEASGITTSTKVSITWDPDAPRLLKV